LPARGPIPQTHHLGRMTYPGSREETGYLLHPSAKDQKGVLKILGSSRILLHLDTQIFKPGQTTLWSHRRLLDKRPSKLGTRPRKGFPGDKETVNQRPWGRAARCNMTIQSLHLSEKSHSSGVLTKWWVHGSGQWPTCQSTWTSGLRVASMSPSSGC
jgi:hypothetical protein